MSQGKLFVIDGTDGSGKTTQQKMLLEKLKQEKIPHETIDFPQYNNKSAGLVEEYLSGKYGKADEVDPRIASIFYAADRYDASFKIKKWLADGKVVIANRYTASNMGHQGSKFSDPQKKQAFFKWLAELEFDLFKIPKPDLNIILHVESEIAQKLALNRAREDWQGKQKDIHESDLNHLKKAEQTYLEIAKTFSGFSLIKCTVDNQILLPEKIHELVWQEIKKHLENFYV